MNTKILIALAALGLCLAHPAPAIFGACAAAAQPSPSPRPVAGLKITQEYRWFVSKSGALRGRTVSYFDNVYAYNHGSYSLTPFDSTVPADYFVIDSDGVYAVAPIVLDITDAMRIRLYGEDVGETALLYGQYCERIPDRRGRLGFSGVHEGIDFIHTPEASLYAILGGEVTRAGDKNGTVGIYSEELDITLLYLHCEAIEVKRGQTVQAGDLIAVEGNKGSGSAYTHVELRKGRHTSSNTYTDIRLQSDCPYPYMREALEVQPSGRQPVTAAVVAAAQRKREEEAAALKAKQEEEQAAKEDEPQIELIDVLPGTSGYGFETPQPNPRPENTLPPDAEK